MIYNTLYLPLTHLDYHFLTLLRPRPAKGHTAYSPVLLGVVILGVKRPEHEVDQLHLCSVDLRVIGEYAR